MTRWGVFNIQNVANIEMKYFLTIAASDNSGGAGIQQDLKVADSLGFWGLSAITGITVQDFEKVDKIYPVSSRILKEQIEKNLIHFDISVIKIGAVCSSQNIKIIASLLEQYKPQHVVLDTVFASSAGKTFIDDNEINMFKRKLFPWAKIITPNKDELALITKQEITNFDHAVDAAGEIFVKYGCSIYITGGHFGEDPVREALISNDSPAVIRKERINMKYTHGTGCTFSSALGCYMANESSLEEACKKATEYVNHIYQGYNL